MSYWNIHKDRESFKESSRKVQRSHFFEFLFSFIQSPKVKRLIVDLLRKMATTTDNTVDDTAVDFIERGLFGVEGLYGVE